MQYLWNITVHQITQDTSYFTNTLLYSRTCKKRQLVLLWETRHTYWDSCLQPLQAWLLWQTSFVFIDLTWLNMNVHLKSGWIYIYMDIPRTIRRRSVVLQRISKPELNRPKLAELFLPTKYIQSNYEFYATERNIGLKEALHCHVDIVKGLINLVDYKRKRIRMIQSLRASSRDLRIQ